MKKMNLLVITLVLLILAGLTTSINYTVLSQEEQKPFYVGVTYCGSSIQEAKELIDKVKNYTNLFVLQSGPLMGNIEAMEEIGDYAVASNLNYAVSGSTKIIRFYSHNKTVSNWLIEAKERWGKQFLGIYYNDEPGGKMLDSTFSFEQTPKEPGTGTQYTGSASTKSGKDITLVFYEHYENPEDFYDCSYYYYADGVIKVTTIQGTENNCVIYYPDGTITADRTISGENYYLREIYTPENITQYPLPLQSYEKILKQHPIQNYEDAATLFVNYVKSILYTLDKKQLDTRSITVFTSDYSLYWWDYKGGYDIVLAQLGWNNSITQEIGLVRGAANLQNKQWGTILTWKYTQPPYLPNGEEMFVQMKTSYEAGAEYVVIFNYSEDPANPNTLQEEHFWALEHFWNEVVQNPEVTHGGIKAEAAFVLPENYGWGMRNPYDTMWGMWPADNNSQEIWNKMQNRISQYGLKLDIVFEDPNYPVEGKYLNIYYYNQTTTSTTSYPPITMPPPTTSPPPTKPVITVILFIILLMISLITLSILVYKILTKRHKNNTVQKIEQTTI
jgi:hypothetical protein